MSNAKRAVIIGAGPAGLTAAYELLKRAGVTPIVLEKSEYMGGISRTVNYKGNRLDIGGHRFFSKSDRVMEWWLHILPMQELQNGQQSITYHHMKRSVQLESHGLDPEKSDKVMLLRPRKSRIYYRRRFFDYPITLSKDTLLKLGLIRVLKIGMSYLKSALFPIKNEKNLEEFFMNRFGKELYLTFFKSYTEKVWGVPCTAISAEWGAQRIKGLSIWKTFYHAIKKAFPHVSSPDIEQKGTETSLIEQFLYPKFGPGQMWEEVAGHVKAMGGTILSGYVVNGLITDGKRIRAIRATNLATGQCEIFKGDYFFSTAPIRDLLRAFDVPPPKSVLEVSEGLVYRDFITVGLLVNRLKDQAEQPSGSEAHH